MAIPSIVQNFYAQQANRQVFLSWDISSGATAYIVQRSLDGINYIPLASPTVNNYLDIAVTVGAQYFYQIAATNTSGTSPYTTPQSVIPSPTSELSLGELRYRSQQKADRVNSNFVTLPEWNYFINLAMNELYDLLITVYEDYFMAPRARFTSIGSNNGNQYIYPLPDGILVFQDINGNNFVPAPFYKLLGVDLAISSASNAFVTVNNYQFIDRNRYIYPNTASTIYGVFNLQYRIMGNNIELIPPPSANQIIQLDYIPRLPQLLKDTDITTLGFSGWLNYVICRAAKYALDKEESDTTKLDQELLFLKARIEETAVNRDAGMPNRIGDARGQGWWGSMSGGWGGGGPIGGY